MSIRYLFGKKKAYTDAETKTKEKTTGSKARSISDFAFDGDVAVKTENLDLFYGEMQALKHIDMTVPTRKVTALIGPSGCGKSTIGRALAKTLGQVWQAHPAQGLYAITADAEFEQHFGKKAARRRKIYNGMIPCQLYMYFEQPKREKR